MHKKELVKLVADDLEVELKIVEKIVDGFLGKLTEQVKKEEVVLRGFGTFKKVIRGARTGTNPRTGEPIDIAESNSVKFKVGAHLKAEINRKN